MILSEMQTIFAEVSGRGDLNGATTLDDIYYLNQGSRFLDLEYPNPVNHRVHPEELSAYGYKVEIPNVRAIMNVTIYDSSKDEEVGRLVYKTPKWLADHYGNLNETISYDCPKYWSNAMRRLRPSATQTQASDFNPQSFNLLFDSGFTKTGVLVAPAADKAYLLRIEGEFYSDVLTNASDVNYWSVQHPHALALAANLMLEATYRDSQSIVDMKRAIDMMLDGVDNDIAIQEVYNAEERRR